MNKRHGQGQRGQYIMTIEIIVASVNGDQRQKMIITIIANPPDQKYLIFIRLPHTWWRWWYGWRWWWHWLPHTCGLWPRRCPFKLSYNFLHSSTFSHGCISNTHQMDFENLCLHRLKKYTIVMYTNITTLQMHLSCFEYMLPSLHFSNLGTLSWRRKKR